MLKQDNEKYCTECGVLINIKAEICPKCGVKQLTLSSNSMSEDQNKWVICLLLCWFVGVFGIHRFYTGHTGIGIAQLLTLGGCGIWALIDFILIVTGNFKDSKGNLIKQA